MKKANKGLVLTALGALALGACTSEDVMAPDSQQANSANSVPISFSVNKGNMSRSTGLETASYDFGVWAVKTGTQWNHTGLNLELTTGSDVVMNKYLVGYYSGAEGYVPNGFTPTTDGSKWYYEHLGQLETSFYNFASTEGFTASTSDNNNQYLKYWDLSKAYVDFFACAPYGAATGFDPITKVMTFDAVVDNANYDVLYGATAAPSSTHAKVPINFSRITAKIRLAFYSELKGYDVQIINFNSSNEGIVCLAANKSDEDTYSAADGTTTGYVARAVPAVTWDDEGTSTLSWAATPAPSLSKQNIVCPLWWNASSDYSSAWSQTMVIPTEDGKRMYGGLRRVVPAGDKHNCGFTVNVSFKLTAIDTKEVIKVYGAKVYVSDGYTQWEPNNIYTYTFKITNQLPGSTEQEQEPGVTPSTPGLFPIIFDNLMVEDMNVLDENVFNL